MNCGKQLANLTDLPAESNECPTNKNLKIKSESRSSASSPALTLNDEASKENQSLICKESAKEDAPIDDLTRVPAKEETEKDETMCTDESAELTIVTESEETSNNSSKTDNKEKIAFD